jgi:hypothetical protein
VSEGGSLVEWPFTLEDGVALEESSGSDLGGGGRPVEVFVSRSDEELAVAVGNLNSVRGAEGPFGFGLFKERPGSGRVAFSKSGCLRRMFRSLSAMTVPIDGGTGVESGEGL